MKNCTFRDQQLIIVYVYHNIEYSIDSTTVHDYGNSDYTFVNGKLCMEYK